jgi:pilus assembly protein Flp/PilA
MHYPPHLQERLGDQEGATAAEYAIMASLIAVVIIGAVLALGLTVTGLFDNADATMSEAIEGD